MQTIILAAGEGTRMRPLTESMPKPMLPVADRPLVAHTIEAAGAAGASRVILVVGYKQEAIREFFGTEYRGVPVEYAVQREPEGTADAVMAARERLDDEPFVVLTGDNLYDTTSLVDMYDTVPAVGSYRVDNPTEYGVLQTTSDDPPLVSGVIEKPDVPPSNLINTGAYVFPAEAREWLNVGQSQRGEYELTDTLNRMCDAFDVQAVPFDRWLDVGHPWELLEANEWKLGQIEHAIHGEVSEDAHIDGPVVVESGATVKPGVNIEGPALIRKRTTVGPNAYIRGNTLLQPNVTIGHAVEVKNSILMAGTTIAHLSYVGDSILGQDVGFGAGTIVANLRHDESQVRLNVKGESTPTGRRKFGVVCGDNVKTGINTSLNTGVKLDRGTRTRPGEDVLSDPK